MKNFLLILVAITIGYQAKGQVAPLPPVQYASVNAMESSILSLPPAPAMPQVIATPALPMYFHAESDEQGLSKTFTRTFPADQSDKISVNNQFGSITIRTWDRKEVKAEVNITAYSSDNDETQKLLDGVSIEAGKQGDQITFRTKMSSTKNNWGNGTRNGRKWRREVKIAYVVYVPASNALTLSQQYGNIDMPAFSGPVLAKAQYGNFNAEKLNNSNNYISVQYGNMNIKELYKGTLKQQYGNGITLGTANDIKLDAQYSNVAIDRLTGNANLNVQYNKVKIGQVTEGAKSLIISAQYAAVDLGFSDRYNGNADVKTSYGSFNFGDRVSARSSRDDDDHNSTSKSYTGTIGNGGSNQVSINAAYGAITFR